MLVVPAALLLYRHEVHDTLKPSCTTAAVSVTKTAVCFCFVLMLLLLGSGYVENWSWDFLRSTYGFLLSVSDLAPNVGIFWYFFTEVFDHFRTFFVFVFQIHAFIYVAPMTIRLRHYPLFLSFSLLALTAVFRLVLVFSFVVAGYRQVFTFSKMSGEFCRGREMGTYKFGEFVWPGIFDYNTITVCQ